MEGMRDAGPNRLLRGLVVVSVVVHLVIAMQFEAGEKQTAKSYMELELQAEEEPESRNIPEPVRRERSVMPETAAVTNIAAPALVVPTSVSPVPDLPDTASPQLLAWVPAAEKIEAPAGEKPVAEQSKKKENLSDDVAEKYYLKALKRTQATP